MRPKPEREGKSHGWLRAAAPVLVLGVLCRMVFPLAAQVRVPPQPPAQVGQVGDYIVRFYPGTTLAERAAAVLGAGAALRFNYRIVDASAVTVPNPNVLNALRRIPSVLDIVADRPVYAIQGPAAPPDGKGKPDKGRGSQEVVPEGVKRVGEPVDGSSDGSNVGVAVLDTGIDLAHRDLAVGSQKYDAFGGTCADGDGHGTHVTGIIAALKNGTDVVGVAPAATPYCVKVLDDSGKGSDATVMAGLDWVFQNANGASPPIRVVNMSLGREGTLDDNRSLRQAVQRLYGAGIAVVVAAGNDPYKEVSEMVPATYPEVFAIASTTAVDGQNKCRFLSQPILADTASYFTTDGKLESGIGVTISAPGEDKEDVNRGCLIRSVGILSLKLGGGTTRMSGTSMAAPHISGVAARYMQNYQIATDEQGMEYLRGLLRQHADRGGEAPLDSPSSAYSFDGEREGIARAP